MTDQFLERLYRHQRSRMWLPPGWRPPPRHGNGSPYVRDGSRRPPHGRAVIGDELREVAAWCELTPCIARYTHAGAAGLADIVARAMADGWRKDALGRLICPPCLQRFPIWSAAPLVPWPPRHRAGKHRLPLPR